LKTISANQESTDYVIRLDLQKNYPSRGTVPLMSPLPWQFAPSCQSSRRGYRWQLRPRTLYPAAGTRTGQTSRYYTLHNRNVMCTASFLSIVYYVPHLVSYLLCSKINYSITFSSIVKCPFVEWD
jgi:hypothetical protein